MTQLEADILSLAEQELGELGGSCGDVFSTTDTWKEVTHVTAVVAEGHIIAHKGSATNMEV